MIGQVSYDYFRAILFVDKCHVTHSEPRWLVVKCHETFSNNMIGSFGSRDYILAIWLVVKCHVTILINVTSSFATKNYFWSICLVTKCHVAFWSNVIISFSSVWLFLVNWIGHQVLLCRWGKLLESPMLVDYSHSQQHARLKFVVFWLQHELGKHTQGKV